MTLLFIITKWHCYLSWQWGLFVMTNGPYELTTKFGSRSVRLIIRDQMGHHMRTKPVGGELWSRGVNPNLLPKQVDNSGCATTLSPIEYLHNDAKHLVLSEKWVRIQNVCHLCWPNLARACSCDKSASRMSPENVVLGFPPYQGRSPGTPALIVSSPLYLPWQGTPILNKIEKNRYKCCFILNK